MMIRSLLIVMLPLAAWSQKDSSAEQRYNWHFQQTVITQYHPTFSAPYSGVNSLQPKEETQTSLTTTLFLGLRLWKHSAFYFNPELAGGAGFSYARGIAGFSNGETFRIGSPAPAIYLGRAYFRQGIPLSKEYSMDEDDLNQLHMKQYKRQINIVAGKYSVADFFDCNSFSHDPRTQFMNWSLMSTGAWDYPANTRGYTVGGLIEYVSPKVEVRAGINLVPRSANGPDLDYNFTRANATTVELQYNYGKNNRTGSIRLLGFYNNAPMGVYSRAVLNPDTTDVTLSRAYGHSKYGAGINLEQNLNSWIGLFARASWNDGKCETWAFTEIDQSAQLGLSFNGQRWNRGNDVLGIAGVVNGISAEHQAYLKKGGYGFIIGDGNLNYAPEMIGEIYYAFNMRKYATTISPDYQLIVNPAYNHDRKGPVSVFSLRLHVQIYKAIEVAGPKNTQQ